MKTIKKTEEITVGIIHTGDKVETKNGKVGIIEKYVSNAKIVLLTSYMRGKKEVPQRLPISKNKIKSIIALKSEMEEVRN